MDYRLARMRTKELTRARYPRGACVGSKNCPLRRAREHDLKPCLLGDCVVARDSARARRARLARQDAREERWDVRTLRPPRERESLGAHLRDQPRRFPPRPMHHLPLPLPR